MKFEVEAQLVKVGELVEVRFNFSLKIIVAAVVEHDFSEEVVFMLSRHLHGEPHRHARCIAVSQGGGIEVYITSGKST